MRIPRWASTLFASAMLIAFTANSAEARITPSHRLQQQVNAQLRATHGGVQISSHEVSYANGNVIVVFPDSSGRVPTALSSRAEAKAAGNAATGAVVATTSFDHGCPFSALVHWYCFYQDQNYGGRMLEFRDCRTDGLLQQFSTYNFNNQTTAWVNTSANDVYVQDNATGRILWTETTTPRSPNVGVANNDKADAITTFCP